MKKLSAVFLALILLLSLASCGESKGSAGVDVDLTKLSATMVYSEVSNMMNNPDSYVGKVIKMTGSFSVFKGDNRNYYSCIISDATACCMQGLEFVWAGEHEYPADYPEENEQITVVGTYELYTEDDVLYCQLANATMTVNNKA